MPIYEYRCDSCKGVVEKLQKFNDPPLSECATCGGRLVRLISPPGLHFKGSGWYVTDYAAKDAGKNGKDREKAKPAGKTESKKTEAKTKSDSKPAATTK